MNKTMILIIILCIILFVVMIGPSFAGNDKPNDHDGAKTCFMHNGHMIWVSNNSKGHPDHNPKNGCEPCQCNCPGPGPVL